MGGGYMHVKQESHAVARKPRYAAAVLFGLKFADNIHYTVQNLGNNLVHERMDV